MDAAAAAAEQPNGHQHGRKSPNGKADVANRKPPQT
jgi:hypothetical protein